MSNPSFSNIDLWLFELNEGNLTPSQVEQLELFLLQHPELDVDKDVWENVRLKRNEEYVYTKKESLKRDYPIFWVMDFASVAVVLVAIVVIGFNSTVGTSARSVSSTISVSKVQTSTASTGSAASATSVSAATPVSKVESSKVLNKSVLAAKLNLNKNVISSNQVVAFNSTMNIKENDLVANSTLTNLYSQNVVQAIESIDEKTNESISSSFYDVNQLEHKSITNEFGNTDYSLIAFNDNNDLNFFQEKKKSISKYQVVMKNRLGAFSRKVMNMMNNPIALKNFRDPHYNIPGLSVSDVNFSSAGTQLATRVQTLSRLQWYGAENQQLMNQLNLDGYVYAVRGGFALQLNHSLYKNGGISIADAAITYSPKISISNTVSFEPSFRFKMGNKSLKHDKMDGANQLEIERGVVEDYYADGSTPIGSNLWYKDLGVGLMVNTKWFFAGVQIDNLFRHKDNMYSNTSANPQRSNYQIIGSLGTDWVSRNKQFSLSPYVVYQNEGKLSELWVGANARLKWFVIGASYSSTQNPSATIGMKFNRFAMYYNADYSKSKMTGERNLSHQVTLKFVGKQSRFGKGR